LYTEKFYIVTPNNEELKFFGNFSFDKDASDCMGTGTLTMPYHNQLWAYWEPGFTELKIYGGTYDEGRIFSGRTRGIKQTGDNKIEISLQDCGWRLKQICYEPFDEEDSVEIVFKALVKSAGMIPIIAGLSKDYQRQDDDESSGTSTGKTVSSGGGSTSGTTTSGSNTTTTKKSTTKKETGNVIGVATTKSDIYTNSVKSIFGFAKSLQDITSNMMKTAPHNVLNKKQSSKQKTLNSILPKAASAMLKIATGATANAANTTTPGTGTVGAKLEGTQMSTQGQACVQADGQCNCGMQPNVKKPMSWKNHCPNCGGTNLNFVYTPLGQGDGVGNPEGRITCGDGLGNGGCDMDWCSVCGKENINGSIISLTPCDGQGEGEDEEEPGTYEDEINKLCEGNDLIWYTTQFNEVVLIDYPCFMEDIKKNAFTVKREYMEHSTFDMDVSQFGFANTVVVKYKNGTVKESYEDLVKVFGEVKKTYNEPTLDKSAAKKKALAALATLLRDFAKEIQVTMLHSHKVQPGCFVNLTNPVTDNTECYYVSGINVTHSPDSTLKSSLTLLYAPENPEVEGIPEIAGPENVGDAVAQIAQAAAKFGYTGNPSAAAMVASGSGDCWAMSDYLYNQLTSRGIKARILQYVTTGSPRHRSVQYLAGTQWVNFPYREYNLHYNFRDTSNVSSGTVIRGG